MSFTGINDVIAASEAGRDSPINKNSSVSQLAGSFSSYWRQANFPAIGAIPGAAAICNGATTGGMAKPTRSVGQTRAALWASVALSVLGTVYMVDRLAHMGGLSGVVTTAQTVNVDVSGATDDLPQRIGAADYTNVRWFIECYSNTGGTAVNATVAVTYSDNSTGNIVVPIPASNNQLRLIEIVGTNGLGIKSVQSVTLSATTGVAGSFGITAMREIAAMVCDVANRASIFDWAALRLVPISDDACLTLISLNTTTTMPAVAGVIRMGVR